jgi:hypothetical protein
MVSDFKPGKWGLNSRLRPVLRGGGTGSHTLPNHVTGNGRSTRHSWWVIKLTRRTAKNFPIPTWICSMLDEHKISLLFWLGKMI